MLGHTLVRYFERRAGPDWQVFGSVRRSNAKLNALGLNERLISGVDMENADHLLSLFARVKPQVVINAVGIVKQLAAADEPLVALPINALLPHRLAQLCATVGARLVHISTDCVFSGTKGDYSEDDVCDAQDLYGRSKLLGEVVGVAHAITLRTSIIGHELDSQHGLLEWFLAQQGSVRGYKRALFSGLPTGELARVIHHHVLPQPQLCGLYHVSADAIDKYALLQLFGQAYEHPVTVVEDSRVVIDRSLNSARFRAATGYQAAGWPQLVAQMKQFG